MKHSFLSLQWHHIHLTPFALIVSQSFSTLTDRLSLKFEWRFFDLQDNLGQLTGSVKHHNYRKKFIWTLAVVRVVCWTGSGPSGDVQIGLQLWLRWTVFDPIGCKPLEARCDCFFMVPPCLLLIVFSLLVYVSNEAALMDTASHAFCPLHHGETQTFYSQCRSLSTNVAFTVRGWFWVVNYFILLLKERKLVAGTNNQASIWLQVRVEIGISMTWNSWCMLL